jgi:uncharacterized membrane protein
MRIFAIAALAASFLLALAACSGKPAYQEVSGEDGEVRIERTAISEGAPAYFSYSMRDKRVDFFVLRLRDGSVEAYIDACRKCYTRKRGFGALDGWIICRLCGERYPVENLKGVGSCYPIPLDVSEGGDGKYIISEDDLVAAAKYF